MRKIYFIFFLFVFISFFSSAQQKNSSLPTQPVQQNTKPTKPTLSSARINKEPSLAKLVTVENAKTKAAKTRRPKLSAAVYGNEWINYSQFYYKIKIGQNGIYRIDSGTLAKAGIPVNSIDNRNYQVFFRGQQQYIYVKSSTAHLSERSGDYIEFYGQYNDGIPDSLVYYNIKFVPNPYYSLFTDTSTYYLTWNSSFTNLRMTEQTDTNFNSYSASPYVMAPSVIAGRAYTKATSDNRASYIYFQNAPQYS